MKRLMISAFAAIVTARCCDLHAAIAPSSPASCRHDVVAGACTSSTDVNKLPIEDFDDQSLVYSKTSAIGRPCHWLAICTGAEWKIPAPETCDAIRNAAMTAGTLMNLKN